jgi:hypothetical protein
MKAIFVSIIACLLTAALSGTAPCAESCDRSKHLFYIANNAHSSVVYYDVCLDGNNNISADNPLAVYWLTKNGMRRELNLIQKTLAYGIRSVESTGRNSISFTIAALTSATITVARINEGYSATLGSEKGDIVIDKVDINVTNGIVGLPTVHYVDVTGRSKDGDRLLKERIFPRPGQQEVSGQPAASHHAAGTVPGHS